MVAPAIPPEPMGQADYAVDDALPSAVVWATSPADVAEALRSAAAHGRAVVPWGSGSQMAFGAPPSRYDTALDLSGLDRVLDHDPANLMVTVEAGARLADVQEALAAERQFIPLDPPYPAATIGGLVATDTDGPWRLGYGGVRDLVLAARLTLASGEDLHLRAESPPKDAELLSLVVGSLGALGVITEVTLRTQRLAAASRTLSVFTYPEPGAAVRLANRMLDVGPRPTALDIFSSAEGAYIILARLEGDERAVEAQARAIESLCRTEYMRRIQIADAKDTREVWEAANVGGSYWDGPRLSYPVIVRLRVPRMAVAPMLLAAKDILRRHDLPRLVSMQAGSGAARIHLGDLRGQSDAAAAVAACLALREAAERLGGYLVVEQAPRRVKERVSVWGATPMLAAVARARARLDPANILNPGRFVQ
ncbi:MAG: FAD-binding oxidoreductase [Anaerolineae bacterium]